MTREETVRNLLTELIDMIDNGSQRDLDRADEIGVSIIKLLEQEPILDRDCEHCSKTYGTLGCCTTVSNKWVYSCKKGQREYLLDKIRAEILEEKEHAYADFERYKVEYLGQDWEDALDSLPQDDFRYGMERAIELIDKYKAETEQEDDNT